MQKLVKNALCTALCVMLMSIGMALTMKADIGVGSINALSMSLSSLTGIYVGTILFFIQATCVLVQFIIQRKAFHWRQWLQLALSYILGEGVNLMLYYFFKDFSIEHYILRVILFVVGIIICTVGVAFIIQLNLVVFPIEAMCTVYAKTYNKSFKKTRQLLDIVAIIGTLVLVVGFHATLSIREGTLLNLLIFSSGIHQVTFFIEKYHVLETIRYE